MCRESSTSASGIADTPVDPNGIISFSPEPAITFDLDTIRTYDAVFKVMNSPLFQDFIIFGTDPNGNQGAAVTCSGDELQSNWTKQFQPGGWGNTFYVVFNWASRNASGTPAAPVGHGNPVIGAPAPTATDINLTFSTPSLQPGSTLGLLAL